MLAEFASYRAWVSGEEDSAEYGAIRSDGRFVLASDPTIDITDLVSGDLARSWTSWRRRKIERKGRKQKKNNKNELEPK